MNYDQDTYSQHNIAHYTLYIYIMGPICVELSVCHFISNMRLQTRERERERERERRERREWSERRERRERER